MKPRARKKLQLCNGLSNLADLEPQLAGDDDPEALLNLSVGGGPRLGSKAGVWGGLAVVVV